MIILFPFEYFFLKSKAIQLTPKLLSFKTDTLETAKLICDTDLIVKDLGQYIDASKAIITHFETVDLNVSVDSPAFENTLKRKNISKLLQTALLCSHKDDRLVPSQSQISSYFPLDEGALDLQWPKLRAWQRESIWLTQHQETKTHMTQLMCMGDVDRLLERCTHVLTQNGIDILKKEHVAKIIASEHKHGHALERVWGYAFKIDSKDNQSEEIPNDLIYIGAISVFAPLMASETLNALEYPQEPSLTHRYKVIAFSQESPIYVTSIVKALNLIKDDRRLLDQNMLMTYSNKTLEPVLERYGFFCRMDDDQKYRILTLYRKKNQKLLRATESDSALNRLETSLFEFSTDQAYHEKLYNRAFLESQNLENRFYKLGAFVFTMHLIELIAFNFTKTASPYMLLIMNLMISSILGISLFVEAVELNSISVSKEKTMNRKSKPKSTYKHILVYGILIGIYCLINQSQFTVVPFVGLTIVGMAFMLQNQKSISLRQIALKKTPLNAASGLLILLFLGLASWEMKSQFDANTLMKLLAFSFTPMILHDLIKLTKAYVHKFSAVIKS